VHTPSARRTILLSQTVFCFGSFFQKRCVDQKLQTIPLLLGMKHKHADAKRFGDLVCFSDIIIPLTLVFLAEDL